MVALVLFLVVGTLVATVADTQRRLMVAAVGQARSGRVVTHALGIIMAQLRAAPAQDISIATDSVLELQLPVAEGVVCEPPVGSTVVLAPAGAPGEGAMTRWRQHPDSADVAYLLDAGTDTVATWVPAAIAAVALLVDDARCDAAAGYAPPSATGRARVQLQLAALPVGVHMGTLLRVQRRLRLSIYRAGDGTGQLGIRRCPAAAAGACSGVQPAAGPLAPPGSVTGQGVHFTYRDSGGVPLTTPLPAAIAQVDITARAPLRDWRSVVRSTVTVARATVALRNHR